MYNYFVNGKERNLICTGRMWKVEDDHGTWLGSGSNILYAILAADYMNVTWDEAHMIESVIIDIMREREGKTCRFQ